ncbi:hypothetical protein [Psychrobacter pygoscelis]|uniref:hypothetical protein n=1 Tax=Psychrobacter pygoscelis TaxID=2488563 RepID=UPI0010391FD5|nr:hypothetical protein [Psychrobacter pygoscelis]
MRFSPDRSGILPIRAGFGDWLGGGLSVEGTSGRLSHRPAMMGRYKRIAGLATKGTVYRVVGWGELENG